MQDAAAAAAAALMLPFNNYNNNASSGPVASSSITTLAAPLALSTSYNTNMQQLGSTESSSLYEQLKQQQGMVSKLQSLLGDAAMASSAAATQTIRSARDVESTAQGGGTVLMENVNAATAALTADPSFTAALAAAITSILTQSR